MRWVDCAPSEKRYRQLSGWRTEGGRHPQVYHGQEKHYATSWAYSRPAGRNVSHRDRPTRSRVLPSVSACLFNQQPIPFVCHDHHLLFEATTRFKGWGGMLRANCVNPAYRLLLFFPDRQPIADYLNLTRGEDNSFETTSEVVYKPAPGFSFTLKLKRSLAKSFQ